MEPMDDQLSDDEIFFGKLSLKELKKHILWNNNPPSKIPEYDHNPEEHSQSLNIKPEIETNNDGDFGSTIIESHSEPNLRSSKNCPRVSSELHSPYARASDDSFLKLENMVDNLCISSNMDTNAELNNTLDVINYILNNGTDCKTESEIKVENGSNEKICLKIEKSIENPLETIMSPSKSKTKANEETKTSPNSPVYVTPVKTETNTPTKTNIFKTPLSINTFNKCDVITSSTNKKCKPPVFKTPAQASQKKQSATSVKKTPSKTNSYQHISSPVASYIKNCPQVRLLKDVHPKKPLPGPSSIPKFTKSLSKNKVANKENIILPSVAYKSAKKTKVIEIPDEEKLPQIQWVKTMTSTLPKPVIMKHNHREMDIAKRSLMQEESFADLPYRQAEVSVCTQKTAYKMNKN